VASRRLEQIQEVLTRGGGFVGFGRPSEAAQDLVRVEDVATTPCGPFAVNEADKVQGVEIAERRGSGVHELYARESPHRCERLGFHAPPHRGRKVVDGPMQVVMTSMGLRERVENRQDTRSGPVAPFGKRLVYGDRHLEFSEE